MVNNQNKIVDNNKFLSGFDHRQGLYHIKLYIAGSHVRYRMIGICPMISKLKLLMTYCVINGLPVK